MFLNMFQSLTSVIYLDCGLSYAVNYSECPKNDGVIRGPFPMTKKDTWKEGSSVKVCLPWDTIFIVNFLSF